MFEILDFTMDYLSWYAVKSYISIAVKQFNSNTNSGTIWPSI